MAVPVPFVFVGHVQNAVRSKKIEHRVVQPYGVEPTTGAEAKRMYGRKGANEVPQGHVELQ